MIDLGNPFPTKNDTPLATPMSHGADGDAALDMFGKGVVKGFMDIAKGITGTVEAGVEAIQGGENEYLSKVTQNIRDAEQPFNTTPTNWIEEGASILGQVVPYIGTMFMGGLFTGGRLIPGALAFLTEGQRAYEEALARGADDRTAEEERLLTGSLNAIIMGSRVGNMLKLSGEAGDITLQLVNRAKGFALSEMAASGKRFAADIGKSAINQAVASMVAEGGNIMIPALLEGKKVIPQDANGNPDYVAWSSQIWERELTAGIVGGGMGVAMPLLTAPAMAGLKYLAAPKPEQLMEARRAIINDKNLGVETKAEMLNQLGGVRPEELGSPEYRLKAVDTTNFTPEEKSLYDDLYTAQDALRPNLEVGPLASFNPDSSLNATVQRAHGTRVEGRIKERGGVWWDWRHTPDQPSRYSEGERGMPSVWETGTGEGGAFWVEGVGGANVTESQITLKNPLVVSVHFPGDEASFPKQLAEILGISFDPFDVVGEKKYAELEKQISDKLRKFGFDGVVFTQRVEDANGIHEVPLQLFDLNSYIKHEGLAGPEYIQIPNELQKMADLQKRLQEKCKFLNKEVRPLSKEQIKEGRAKQAEAVKGKLQELAGREDLSPQAKAQIAQAAAKGPMVARFKPLAEDGFTPEDMQAMYNVVNTSPLYQKDVFSAEGAWSAIGKLFEQGQLPEPNELRDLEPIIGRTGVQALLSARKKASGLGEKIFWGMVNALNFPKAVLASSDMSGTLRQGWQILFTNPKAWGKGLLAGYRAWISPEYSDFHDVQMRTHPLYNTLKRFGLALTEPGTLQDSEEPFISYWAHKIPGVSAAERGYSTSLNTMRFYTAARAAEKMLAKGQATPHNLKVMCDVINAASGRGRLGSLERLAPALNILTFAPRYAISVPQRLTDWMPRIEHEGFKPTGIEWSPGRKIAAAGLVTEFGIGAGILAMLASLKKSDPKTYKDLDVEADPRSADFGKIRIGDTRIDYWSGQAQFIRLVAQLATGQRKTVDTKEIQGVDAGDVVARFLQSKSSPLTSTALSLWTGKDFQGNPVEGTTESVTNQLYQGLTPLVMQDIVDAIHYQGLTTAAWTAPMAFHGIGLFTYEPSTGTKAQVMRNAIAQENFGKKWDDLSSLAQSLLRAENPMIDQLASQAHNDRLTAKINMKYDQEQRDTERFFMNSVPAKDRQVLLDAGVNLGSISRRVGEDWQLNDKRYNAYKTQVAAMLRQEMPALVAMNLTPSALKIVAESMAQTIKQTVRNRLTANAIAEDFVRRS